LILRFAEEIPLKSRVSSLGLVTQYFEVVSLDIASGWSGTLPLLFWPKTQLYAKPRIGKVMDEYAVIQALTAIGTSICLMIGRLINTAVESPQAYVA
jgi:hypothetical protein